MSSGHRNNPCQSRIQTRLYCYIIIFVLLWLSCRFAYAISDLSLTLGRIEFQNIVAADVVITVDFHTGDTVAFTLSSSMISLAGNNIIENLMLDCDEGRLSGILLSCTEGTYSAQHRQSGNISGRMSIQFRLDGNAGHITLPNINVGTGTIAGSLDFNAGNWTADLQVENLELSSLRTISGMLDLWPMNYSGESGAFDINIKAEGNRDGLQSLEGTLHTHMLSFYGDNAAEELSAELSLALVTTDGWRARVEGSVDSGAVFIDSGINAGNIRPGIALEITEQPLRFAFDLNIDRPQKQIQIYQLQLDHPGIMTTQLTAIADWQEGFSIHNAELDLTVQEAGEFYSTYLQPFLLNTQFNNLVMTGAFTADAHINITGLAHLDLQFFDLVAYDKNGRFNISGLDGAFRITDATTPVESTLTWASAGLYRLMFGAGKLVLESSEQSINIVSWDDVPVLDGQLQIDSFSIINPGRADMTVKLDGALTPVSMVGFTGSMGWPIMSGELTASIDGLTYSQGRLVVGGVINLGLFDGNVNIRNLYIENLFGLVPALYADIDIDLLDLELLTNRFTFGQIQGRLSGKVHNLELQAWEPVYFEAELATPKDDPSRHRISQKAVENLGYLGGGSGGALSGGFLQIFKNYSYGRMGISCRLFNGLCEMGGVDSTADGFIIVSRGGLLPPWIEVKGTGHSISWVTLIEGLKTITTNQPEFE